MSDKQKFVQTEITVGESPYGFGDVTGKFKAEKYAGSPLLDTQVDLTINPFCITWESKEKMLEEIAAIIAKYQI